MGLRRDGVSFLPALHARSGPQRGRGRTKRGKPMWLGPTSRWAGGTRTEGGAGKRGSDHGLPSQRRHGLLLHLGRRGFGYDLAHVRTTVTHSIR